MSPPLQHCRIDTVPGRGVTVWIDVADRSVNVVSAALLRELELVYELFAQSQDQSPIIVRSAKPSGFLAGADLKRLAGLQTVSEAMEFLHQGRQCFERWATLDRPTVAVIHGACLGGGLEFALACRFRIARNDSHTRLGMPETTLGLIPGWGGTQRLPERIGVGPALRMMLPGAPVSPREALQRGLVDAVFEADQNDVDLFYEVGQSMASDVRQETVSRPSRRRRWERTAFGRWWTFRSAQALCTMDKSSPAACRAILNAVRAGLEHGSSAGLAVEQDEYCRLLFSPDCRQRLEQFFAARKSIDRS